jgi:hypothetical protein
MYLRNYIETVIATCFFKVPEFRDAFLESVKKSKNDIEVHELTLIGLSNLKNRSDSSFIGDDSGLLQQ